jgi:hypothetical protein
MYYTCQDCGASADNQSSLCNPSMEVEKHKFCGVSPLLVCVEKRTSMKFICDACGSVSADAAHLCSPSKRK